MLTNYYPPNTRFYKFSYDSYIVEDNDNPFDAPSAIDRLRESAANKDIKLFKQTDGTAIAVYNGMACRLLQTYSMEAAVAGFTKLQKDANNPVITEVLHGEKTCNCRNNIGHTANTRC